MADTTAQQPATPPALGNLEGEIRRLEAGAALAEGDQPPEVAKLEAQQQASQADEIAEWAALTAGLGQPVFDLFLPEYEMREAETNVLAKAWAPVLHKHFGACGVMGPEMAAVAATVMMMGPKIARASARKAAAKPPAPAAEPEPAEAAANG